MWTHRLRVRISLDQCGSVRISPDQSGSVWICPDKCGSSWIRLWSGVGVIFCAPESELINDSAPDYSSLVCTCSTESRFRIRFRVSPCARVCVIVTAHPFIIFFSFFRLRHSISFLAEFGRARRGFGFIFQQPHEGGRGYSRREHHSNYSERQIGKSERSI